MLRAFASASALFLALAPAVFSLPFHNRSSSKQLMCGPVIHLDNRVMFRIDAKASEVTVRWGSHIDIAEPVAMTNDNGGMWSVTVGPLDPEFYGYSFIVDGMRLIDPCHPEVKRDGAKLESILLVPGPGSDLYANHNFPHVTLSLVWYHSASAQMMRRMQVYTPAGCDDSKASYPVHLRVTGGVHGGSTSRNTRLSCSSSRQGCLERLFECGLRRGNRYDD